MNISKTSENPPSGINIFGLLGVGLAGPLIDTIGPWLTCIVAIPFSSAIILPTLSGWLSEKRIEGTQLQNSCIGFRKDMFTEHRNFFVTALALGASSLTCTATAMFVQDSTTKLVVTLVASFICCSIAWILLPRDIAKALLYFYGSSAINIYISGPVFYFYTDPPEVCADCPHFSATFFTTFIGLVDCTFSIFGVFIFNRFMRNWTFRSALVVTQIIAIIASLIDIVQFQRWISPHPISDEWLALGKAGFQNTSLMMNFLPGSILISRMCPKNIETLSFALLAGFSNFGSSCAAYFGAFVIELFPGLGDVVSTIDNGDRSGAVVGGTNVWRKAIGCLCLGAKPLCFVQISLSLSLSFRLLSPRMERAPTISLIFGPSR